MSVSSRVKNKTHKYGIEVPKNVLYAYIFYRANGNNYLSKVVVKQMNNVLIAVGQG